MEETLIASAYRISRLSFIGAAVAVTANTMAAQGEMGTGVPNFGMYSAATGTSTIVWSLGDATTPFPAGCARIVLHPQTMGMDAYKLAVGTLVAAKLSNKKVRFYAHASRDDGCGVDYVQIVD